MLLFNRFSYYSKTSIKNHSRTVDIALDLACNTGSCTGISLKRDECHLHLKRLPALASAASLFQSNSENPKMAYCLDDKQNLFSRFLT